MKKLLFTLAAISILLVFNFEGFAQTNAKQKLVKCYERGKVVYRTKCKVVKQKSSAQKKQTNNEPYGEPSTKFEISGSGSGQGVGNGRGQGSGVGTGNGSGTVPDIEKTDPPPPPAERGEYTALKILSKPRAESTEESRKNSVEGTVTLRVTFLADGTIGSVTPVSGLPNGLTDKAIEAAKKIKFEPATRDGKPITVTKQVQYSFTLF